MLQFTGSQIYPVPELQKHSLRLCAHTTEVILLVCTWK